MIRSRTLFLVCSVVLLGNLFFASGHIFSNDGFARFEVTKSLVREGRFHLPDDPEGFPLGVDGKRYTYYGLGHSLMMIPGYLAGEGIARFMPSRKDDVIEFTVSFTNLAFTVALAGLILLFACELDFTLATGATLALVFSFGTMAFQQAKDSFEHPQIAFYVTALFFFLNRFSRSLKIRNLLLGGFFMGLAILTRPTSILLYVPVAVFLALLSRNRNGQTGRWAFVGWCLAIGLTSLPFFGFDFWFNYVRFGDPFETGVQRHYGGLFANPVTFPQRFWDLLLGWKFGLFIFNPILALFPFGLFAFFRKRQALAVSFCTAILLQTVFYSLTKPQIGGSGGWAWGPRYLFDVMPLMMLLAGPVFTNTSRWVRAVIGCLLIASFVIQLESVLVNFNRSFTKQWIGVGGHSQQETGPKSSLIYIQAENIVEVAKNLMTRKEPLKEVVPVSEDLASLKEMDDSLTFGTFQLWWISLLHLGLFVKWVWVMVGLNLLLLLFSALRLGRMFIA